ncbi:MAG TPA: hypothetical protein VFZ89_02915 [Solirubrobacteraceae bacterium]
MSAPRLSARVAEARRPKRLGATRRLLSAAEDREAPRWIAEDGEPLTLDAETARWMATGELPAALVPFLGTPTFPGDEPDALGDAAPPPEPPAPAPPAPEPPAAEPSPPAPPAPAPLPPAAAPIPGQIIELPTTPATADRQLLRLRPSPIAATPAPAPSAPSGAVNEAPAGLAIAAASDAVFTPHAGGGTVDFLQRTPAPPEAAPVTAAPPPPPAPPASATPPELPQQEDPEQSFDRLYDRLLRRLRRELLGERERQGRMQRGITGRRER